MWGYGHVVGDDPGPVVVTEVTSCPLGEPFEFAGCIPSIVPAVATAAFPLVLEVALEAVVESSFRTRRAIADHRLLARICAIEIRWL